MNLYVANCTHQNHALNFRLPESPKLHTLKLPAGKQGMVGDKNGLNQFQVDDFIEKMSVFGLVEEDKINGNHGVIPYVCSVDRPVRYETMLRVIDHNRGVMRDDGKKRRIEAAMAITEAANAAGPLKELEASIEQVSDGTAPVDGPRVEEGYIMSKNPGGDARGAVKNTKAGRKNK